MSVYLMLTTLTDEGRKALQEDPEILKEINKEVEYSGVKLLTQYALLGQYDFVNILEAPSNEVVAKLAIRLSAKGTTQTLTLAIRGIALGQLTTKNSRWLMAKELAVGAINSVIWAVVIGAIAGIWFQDSGIALLIAAAITINLLFAALAGAVLPLLLERMGIDPALAGGVLLTTVTDVVGFLAFLGLATLFLL